MDCHGPFAVTAWRNTGELLQVRHDLYSAHVAGKERALSKIFAWRLRKPQALPLLLDSTADIVDAILQDEKGQLKHNALRLLYAAAISRFVTGLADTQIELARDRPSWFPTRKCLQLPSTLLETRHRIVHRHLPSLAELKRAAKESLDWLWDWYWTQLDYAFSDFKHHEDIVPTEPVREKLTIILKTYVKERKNEIKAGQKDSKAAENAFSNYQTRFASSGPFAQPTKVQNMLLTLLIHEKMMLPLDRKLGSSMSGAFLIWTPLLQTLCLSSPGTCTMSVLLRYFLSAMNVPPMSQTVVNTEVDPAREGIQNWLTHLLTSDQWMLVREREGGDKLTEDVLASCFSEPTPWNLKVAASVLDEYNMPNKEPWRALLEAATCQDALQAHVNPVEQSLPLTDLLETALEDGFHNKIAAKEKTRGPQKVLGMWKGRPIGWFPEEWENDTVEACQLD